MKIFPNWLQVFQKLVVAEIIHALLECMDVDEIDGEVQLFQAFTAVETLYELHIVQREI